MGFVGKSSSLKSLFLLESYLATFSPSAPVFFSSLGAWIREDAHSYVLNLLLGKWEYHVQVLCKQYFKLCWNIVFKFHFGFKRKQPCVMELVN